MTSQTAALEGLDQIRILRIDPTVLLRPAAPEDAAAFRAFYIAAREAEFLGLGLPSTMLSTLLQGQFDAQQAGYRAQFPDLQTLAMIHESALIGRLMLSRDGEASVRIVDIAIAEAWRSRGLGGNALRLVADIARGAGFAALTLQVHVDNFAARRLYERMGFVASGLDPAGMSMAMRKLLEGGAADLPPIKKSL